MTLVHPASLFQTMVIALAGRICDIQNQKIAYLEAENRILKAKYLDATGRKRILLTDRERALLGRLAHAIGPQGLKEIQTMFKPDTLLRWFKRFVSEKYTPLIRKVGRPPIPEAAKKVLIAIAKVNEMFGAGRLARILTSLGYPMSKSSVLRVLKDAGVPPAPERERHRSWIDFTKQQWAVLAAVDFTTIEIATYRGIRRIHLLFAMELHSRKVAFVGMVPEPNNRWMAQKARELVDFEQGFLLEKRYLLADRAKVFHGPFAHILKSEGVKMVKLPAQSPNLNAHIERFFRSLKAECLNRVIFFSEASLEKTVKEYVAHYHYERHHQGLGGQLIVPDAFADGKGEIRCRERLGGMLRYYHRDAA